mmetsp:Transcript_27815/g.55704  ORF Transcript_27815/g.55704 Transcript_27815/m.55704 type:complete len:977 (-) Transcript_27815:169-3099(-)
MGRGEYRRGNGNRNIRGKERHHGDGNGFRTSINSDEEKCNNRWSQNQNHRSNGNRWPSDNNNNRGGGQQSRSNHNTDGYCCNEGSNLNRNSSNSKHNQHQRQFEGGRREDGRNFDSNRINDQNHVNNNRKRNSYGDKNYRKKRERENQSFDTGPVSKHTKTEAVKRADGSDGRGNLQSGSDRKSENSRSPPEEEKRPSSISCQKKFSSPSTTSEPFSNDPVTNSVAETKNDKSTSLKSWKETVLSYYHYPPDNPERLPSQAYIPDTAEEVKMKEHFASKTIELVMKKMIEAAKKEKNEQQANDNYDSNNDNNSEDSDDYAYYLSCVESSRSDNISTEYEQNQIELFFNSLIKCPPLTIGFKAYGVWPKDDENCHCPCNNRSIKWIEFNGLGEIVWNKCQNHKKLTPIGLMAHLRKTSETCTLHWGIMKYMEMLYCKEEGSYLGGIGHKGMYQVGDEDWKCAEAAEKRSLHYVIMTGEKHLAMEKAKNIQLEAEINKKNKSLELLEKTNKECSDRIKQLNKERKELNVERKVSQPKTDGETLIVIKKSIGMGFRIIKKGDGRSVDSLQVKVPQSFKVQDFFDKYYIDKKDKRRPSILFHSLDRGSGTSLVKNVYGCQIMNSWNVNFENEAKNKAGKMDTAKDEGGPTREFLAQCWRQMGDLKVYNVELFEKNEDGVVPLTDEILEDRLSKNKDVELKKSLDQAMCYYRALGRIILHSLANGHTIAASVMPPLYLNFLFRDCSPKDKDYHNDDVLKHLIASGTSKRSLSGFVDMKHEFVDGSTEIITTDGIFTKLIPDIYLHSRRKSLSAIKEGLTLDGNIPLCDIFKTFELEAVQKIAFSSTSLTAKALLGVLEPHYGAGFEGSEAAREKIVKEQIVFFEDTFCKVLRDKGSLKTNYLSLFLKFCTGFDYLPDPDANPEFKVFVEFNSIESPKGAHPVAHTCTKELKLPGDLYSDRNAFEGRLDEAVINCHDKFTMQ